MIDQGWESPAGDAAAPGADSRSADGPSAGRATVETAGLFAWHRGRWGAPRVAVVCDVSASAAVVVLGANRPLPQDRAYALRVPGPAREPLWTMGAVASQEQLGPGLLRVTFRFASRFRTAEAA